MKYKGYTGSEDKVDLYVSIFKHLGIYSDKSADLKKSIAGLTGTSDSLNLLNNLIEFIECYYDM